MSVGFIPLKQPLFFLAKPLLWFAEEQFIIYLHICSSSQTLAQYIFPTNVCAELSSSKQPPGVQRAVDCTADFCLQKRTCCHIVWKQKHRKELARFTFVHCQGNQTHKCFLGQDLPHLSVLQCKNISKSGSGGKTGYSHT